MFTMPRSIKLFGKTRQFLVAYQNVLNISLLLLFETYLLIITFFADFQYPYGIPGLPGAYNPFLLGPAWLDAAYMQYNWPDYFRSRTATIPQPTMHPPPILKGNQPQLPPSIPQATEIYLPHMSSPPAAFHPPGLLQTNGVLPQIPSELSKLPPFQIRPPQPLEQLSIRLSPVSNTQSISPQQSLSQERDTRINSTVDHSHSEHSEDEDEIDVVKSAFQPIKPANLLLQEIQHPDSTVQEEPVKKCELKAPSSRRLQAHHQNSRPHSLSPKSPSTKLHNGANAAKSVWRPY